MQNAKPETTARDAIAHCLLMGRGAYPTPQDWADGVMKRLAHEGYDIVRRHADYRLADAAPDLLAALEAVVSVADRKTDEFDLAHAAIAKAKGVQNV